MRKALSLILALVLCLSLCACGEMKMTKEAMLSEAESGVYADEITADIACNFARAKNYEGKVYNLVGHILSIEENYCVIAAAQVDGDKTDNVHRDNWNDFQEQMVFHAYLPVSDLAEIEVCENIQIIGCIDKVEKGQLNEYVEQICLVMKTAYLIQTDLTYNNTK